MAGYSLWFRQYIIMKREQSIARMFSGQRCILSPFTQTLLLKHVWISCFCETQMEKFSSLKLAKWKWIVTMTVKEWFSVNRLNLGLFIIQRSCMTLEDWVIYLSYFFVYILNLDSLFFYIKEQREHCSKHSSFVVHSRKSYRFGTKCINTAFFLKLSFKELIRLSFLIKVSLK